MKSAPLHPQEDARIAALEELQILDTETEQAYDELVELAAMVADTPIALVSLIDRDRQWFKAHHGIDTTETPRNIAFCSHAILKPGQPFIVNDTLKDERFVENPLVTGAPHIRFYAGIPIQAGTSPMPIGTMCVISDKVQKLSQEQISSLTKIAHQVERLFLLRSYAHKLSEQNHQLEIATNAKSRFLATMSHDIRTPINGIIGCAELLSDSALTADAAKKIDIIRQCSNSLLHIINNILDLSKIEAGGLQLVQAAFDLRALSQNLLTVISERAKSKQLNLILDIDDAVPAAVYGDNDRVHQILLNLLGNAVKFTDHGFIRLSIQPSEVEGRLTLTVSDSGKGMSAEECAHIFDPFVQVGANCESHQEGNGLGLSIVNALTQAMHGTINIKSTQGEGTIFTLTIPLPAAEHIVQAETPSHDSISGIHVLAVDDDPINRLVIAAILKKLNTIPTTVTSGSEALAHFGNHHFDVILMDCQMPEMDGYETTRQWRALEQKNKSTAIPILALTANAFEKNRQTCQDAGMNTMLTKPITATQLAQALQSALANSPHIDTQPNATALQK